jgi:hypothetical protein
MPQDVRCRLVALGIQQTQQRKAQVPGVRQYQSGQNSLFGSSKNIKKELKTPARRKSSVQGVPMVMIRDATKETYVSRPITIPADGVQLEGMLVIPPRARVSWNPAGTRS